MDEVIGGAVGFILAWLINTIKLKWFSPASVKEAARGVDWYSRGPWYCTVQTGYIVITNGEEVKYPQRSYSSYSKGYNLGYYSSPGTGRECVDKSDLHQIRLECAKRNRTEHVDNSTDAWHKANEGAVL